MNTWLTLWLYSIRSKHFRSAGKHEPVNFWLFALAIGFAVLVLFISYQITLGTVSQKLPRSWQATYCLTEGCPAGGQEIDYTSKFTQFELRECPDTVLNLPGPKQDPLVMIKGYLKPESCIKR